NAGQSLVGDVAQAIGQGQVNLDSVTHDWQYIPASVCSLSFDLIEPLVVVPNSKIDVYMQLEDGSAEGLIGKGDIQPGFFTTHTYTVDVPEEFRGHVGRFRLQVEHQEASLGQPGDSNLISQIFFLDNVRLDADGAVPMLGDVEPGGSTNSDLTPAFN